jgi:hypothetical protein
LFSDCIFRGHLEEVSAGAAPPGRLRYQKYCFVFGRIKSEGSVNELALLFWGRVAETRGEYARRHPGYLHNPRLVCDRIG